MKHVLKYLSCIRVSCLVIIWSFLEACSPSCAPPEMFFEVFFQINPNVRTYNIGDTLWLQTQFSSFMKDEKGGAVVDFSNAENFGVDVGFLLLNPETKTRPSADSFTFVEKIGSITIKSESSKPTLRRAYFAENNRLYELKIGIITKEKGIFTIGLNYSPNVKRKNAGKCDAYARVNYKYQVANLHFDLYQQFNPQALNSQNFYSFIVE
ncbi:MAG: hypothetical protein NZ551_07840 [Microscillaceae bacterium]|nr:hypothetical protein [Microscillaceae bacterium]MDW8461107.1 hypothetical protein [Cytophagales bacterium]